MLFCSNKCKTESWESYHKYECPIIASLNKAPRNILAALRISLCWSHTFANLHQLTSQLTAHSCIYKSDNYTEVHNLSTNAKVHTAETSFGHTVVAASIFELVEKHTTYFNKYPGKYLYLLHTFPAIKFNS